MSHDKILFMGPYPPPYGGISSHLSDLLPGLVKNGNETYSITITNENRLFESPGMTNEYIDLTTYVKTNPFTFIKNLLRFLLTKKDLGFLDYVKAVALTSVLAKRLSVIQPTQVFFYEYHLGLCIPMIRQFKIGKKLPFHLMLFAGPYERTDYFKSMKQYLRKMVDGTDTLFASSDYCACIMEKVLGFQDPFKVIYIGVDTNVYTPENTGNNFRKRLGISDETKIVLFLGRMHAEMGLDFVLDEANSILDTDPNIHLLITGAEGPLSDEVKTLAEQNMRVHYLVNFPKEDKPNIYAASDILIAPTLERHACMGVSIKEAMASGLPVIASVSGGIPEAVKDNDNGYLIPIIDGRVDSKLFIDKIHKLMEDQYLRDRMANAGRKKALELFSNEATVSRYQSLLKQFGNFI